VDVAGSNVTLKNVKIKTPATGWFGVALRHTSNVTIQNADISGTNTGNGRMLAGIKDIYGDSSGTRVLSSNIYYVSTGVQMDEGLIQDSYIHDLGFIAGDHLNGTTSNGADGKLLTIQHNTVFNQNSQTDAISLFEDFGRQYNRVINNNLVAGGGYTIYGGQNAGGAAVSDIRITNNRISKLYYPGGGYWGYHGTNENYGSNGNVWSGNVWDDTGATVGP
jgi:hypothetical protein